MTGITNYPAFCLAVLVFLALPGPGTFAVLTSAAKGGLRGGFASLAGIILGDLILVGSAMLGVAALLAANPGVFRSVQWLGIAYLLWVGGRLLFSRQGTANATLLPIVVGKYFRQTFLITLINPKAIVFYMAFFPLFIDPSLARESAAMLATFAAMVATIAVLTVFYGGTLVFVGNAVARAFERDRLAGRLATKAAGIALIAFGIRMAF